MNDTLIFWCQAQSEHIKESGSATLQVYSVKKKNTTSDIGPIYRILLLLANWKALKVQTCPPLVLYYILFWDSYYWSINV